MMAYRETSAESNININDQFFLQAYAQENGLAYWETSAKSNINVNDVFVDIASRLPQAQTVQPTATGIQLTEQTPSQPRRGGCC